MDVIVSTVGLALLAALFVVYAKTYRDTGARSALGLIFVLAAFLLEGTLTSPILFGAFGHVLGELGTGRAALEMGLEQAQLELGKLGVEAERNRLTGAVTRPAMWPKDLHC